ncbi:MAG: U32 family peptidase [Deltaproteobacteria bacterium]|nr:U32 family peptidase [Deltaproteobacteria bacterium]
MELTIGPILFEWKREDVLRFYEEAAAMPVDRVYVGEVVCAKKRGVSLDDIGRIRDGLVKAGKKVTLSSLAVVSNEEELELTRRLCGAHDSVEANDVSVLNMVDASKTEVFAGPHITSYNAPSIEFLKSIGVRRAVLPVELPRESVAHNIKHGGLPAEVFSHGYLPLAFSWRCYTSRAYGLTKTGCKHHCGAHPEGMVLKTTDGRPLFRANGTSILSADAYTLVELVEDLREIGAAALRVSPQLRDTAKAVNVFRRRMDGVIGAKEALEELRLISGGSLCNGWYMGGPGKDYLDAIVAAG